MTYNRRRLLTATGTALAVGLAGCASNDDEEPTEDGDDGTTAGTTQTTTEETAGSPDLEGEAVTLDNVGARAWELVDGGVGPTGTENPDLAFEVGQRYVVTNGGWSAHPLAFRAADDTPLLSQSDDGTYEDDPEVNWIDDDGRLAFTVTEGLAADWDYYICTVHSSMEGDLAGGGGDTTTETTQTTEETTTETTTEETTTEEPPASVSLTLDNVGSRAWEVTEEGASVAQSDGENPTLAFEVGTRYEVTNDGWSVHPLAFRAADDASLLNQSGNGRYDDDPEVDWRNDGGTLAFTVTEDLAADLDYYICTVHSAMRGDVEAQ